MSGSCHRSAITENGTEIIFGVKKPSDNFIQAILGVLILYGNNHISVNNFVADNSCRCYRIPKQVVYDYVKDKPELLSQLISLAVHEVRELAGSFQARLEGKVANRLCEQLLKNAQLKSDKLLVSKDFSNYSKMGQLLGIHKVTVAKILKILKEEGIIKKDKNGLMILDEKRLKSYANSEKTLDY